MARSPGAVCEWAARRRYGEGCWSTRPRTSTVGNLAKAVVLGGSGLGSDAAPDGPLASDCVEDVETAASPGWKLCGAAGRRGGVLSVPADLMDVCFQPWMRRGLSCPVQKR